MHISDLQHIEAATATEVKGGTSHGHGYYSSYYQGPDYGDSANAEAGGFGISTKPFTNTKK